MILTYTKRPTRAYALVTVALGMAALAVSLPTSAHLLWEARYLMLAFCAVTTGTRVCLKVPRAASAVPVSMTFVLLTALLYGFEAAVPVAALAAVVSSLRLSRRGGLLLSDAAPSAVATLAAGLAAGATLVEAAMLANHAAGVVVGKLGTATATAAELLESFRNDPRP